MTIFFLKLSNHRHRRDSSTKHTDKSVNHYHQHWIEKLAWPETKNNIDYCCVCVFVFLLYSDDDNDDDDYDVY